MQDNQSRLIISGASKGNDERTSIARVLGASLHRATSEDLPVDRFDDRKRQHVKCFSFEKGREASTAPVW